jgi:hypothetical protein
MVMHQWKPRQVSRLPVRLQVSELDGHPGEGTYLVDLSPLGAQIETSTLGTPGSYVRLRFFLPGDQEETNLVGMVVWINVVLNSPGQYLWGLSFPQPNWELDRKIRSLEIIWK